MMLPATIPHFRQMLPLFHFPRPNTRPVMDRWMSCMLEFAAFAGFLAMCIGLIAEFS